MQRFIVALFAAFALLAVSFPAVNAHSSGVHRRQTNADRLRRGEAPLAPANLRRHFPTTTTTTPSQPSPIPNPPGTCTPPSNGTVQCRGSDGSTIGYIGSNHTLVPSLSQGSTCNLVGGVLSLVGGVVEEATSILGAVLGNVLQAGTSTVTDILTTSSADNAVTWDYNCTTGQLTPHYSNPDGSKVPCNVFYDAVSLKLSVSADVEVANLVAVDLHLIV